MVFTNQKIVLVLVMCLTLGLAPFTPEPHLVGKVRWLLGGGTGMTSVDYFDLLLHGLPWLVLIFMVLGRLKNVIWKSKPGFLKR